MTYKIRHKGKPKEKFLPPGLMPILVQVLIIVVALIVAIMLPKHPGRGDPVVVVALSAAGAGGVLAGLTRLAQAILGHRAKEPKPASVLTFLYRTSFVLATSGLIATFFRTVFR